MREWDGLSTRFGEYRVPELERIPFPEPLVARRLAEPSEVPDTAVMLWRMALEGGWGGSVTYAKGWRPHATTGRPLAKPVESIAVRLQHPDGRRGVGLWLDRAWKEGWVIVPVDRAPYRLGSEAFRTFVRARKWLLWVGVDV